MANYNAEAYLPQALQSVLDQTFKDIELIFVDDGSTDSSVDIAQYYAAKDSRLRVFSGQRRGGPSPVRNFALDQARGDWIAVVDSDDHIHPERFERLLQFAEAKNVDILIDDLLIFDNEGIVDPKPLFTGVWASKPTRIDLITYIHSNVLYGPRPGLGYAKPIIRRAALAENAIRYDETMRIGEDYDLIARLLSKGCVMFTTPELLYFYRKHNQSISYRFDKSSLNALRDQAERALRAEGLTAKVKAAQNTLFKSITRAIAYDHMVDAIKMHRIELLLKAFLREPSAISLLRLPVIKRLKSLWPRPATKTADIAVIVRQRVVGQTNGSSTYLLALCRFLSLKGRSVSLFWPSRETFGRWPVLKLKPDMAFINDVQWCYGWKFGDLVFCKLFSVYCAFISTALESILLKTKIVSEKFVPPADSALTGPYRRKDVLFVAKKLKNCRAIIADYAFCTPYLPYALNAKAPTMVLMHDLFASRASQFADKDVKDPFGAVALTEEMALLDKANAVIAIQAEEAAVVFDKLKDKVVLLAPVAVDIVDYSGKGDQNVVFFVGSNAPPNVLGLQWFFTDVWPLVLAQRPRTVLKIAGNVGRALSNVPQNVQILGVVDDLEYLYENAAVVISPLTTGSGLKIKLIEAMAHAKASVVTSITLQGVESLAGSAVLVADSPDDFANSVVMLLNNPDARLKLSENARECIERHFSAENCFADVLNFVQRADAPAKSKFVI